ncbi:hypothetical protein ACFY0R_11875 [Streptomyces sp. NPDC001633]|uniref:hypothetical protein n=1 Tax=Streptomyces sp. NPDC001633 TaxID=3364595 RepID=UPI003699F561
MSFNPHEIVTVELDCVGWDSPYSRDITRHQLGELLLKLDDMAEGATTEPEWPTPEQAYADAPSIAYESGWTEQTAKLLPDELDRDWYLRHAALLDRIALGNEADQPGRAAEEADATALVLLDMDQAPRGFDARAYVRQQYALWAAEQMRAPWGNGSK